MPCLLLYAHFIFYKFCISVHTLYLYTMHSWAQFYIHKFCITELTFIFINSALLCIINRFQLLPCSPVDTVFAHFISINLLCAQNMYTVYIYKIFIFIKFSAHLVPRSANASVLLLKQYSCLFL